MSRSFAWLAEKLYGARPSRRGERELLHRDVDAQPRAPAAGTVERETTVEGADAIGEPAQPGAAPGIRAADSVVLDLEREARGVAFDADHGAARVRVLRDVGKRLRDDEVGRRLDVSGQPTSGA